MNSYEIYPSKSVRGEITVPGDKSVSHRAVMLGALARGKTYITGFLPGADCLATIDCFQKTGIKIKRAGTNVTVYGKGLNGLTKYGKELYAANSGTTARLLCGILAGQNFTSVINGDASLQKRPMDRIISPLRLMGAEITAKDNNFCPLSIKGGKLKAIDYTLPVASAQIKSCILLAAMYADGTTAVRERLRSRDHTELMLKAFGGNVTVSGNDIYLKPAPLYAREVKVPSDISSAAFFIVLTLISDGGSLLIKNVGVNPTRTGIIDALKLMGGHIELLNIKNDIEPVCDIYVKSSKLKGINIGAELIPRLIDEIPALSVAAAFAEGKTVISGAGELKFKETNRISVIVREIGKCGARFTETDDGMVIEGTKDIKKAVYDSCGDHRIAMAAAVAAAFFGGTVQGADCVSVSCPGFFDMLKDILV